ncbi:hypothetical protein PBI_BERNARDO_86 [Mycobacterium phage Bernardo]|uniref:Uncharacterized protein n=1 Tax=Mycobacterium phage Bernardo TaxID=1429903 RepID=V5R997_9CAUD|nr:hypothetical protein X818_gp086 [Mycobacterium phage Bernardo]AHB31763.1 hypothetical protein PBI_BERNARDO_86 [Mycobacterium phage Bernardo]
MTFREAIADQGRHHLGFPRTSVEFIAWLVTLDGRCEMCGFVFGHAIDCPWRRRGNRNSAAIGIEVNP